MSDETTLTGGAGPAAARDGGGTALAVGIGWCDADPGRTGEVALIPPHGAARLLGRGQPRADDPAPRLVFLRMRPGRTLPTPPLSQPRLSRRQLLIEPAGEALQITQLGRAQLYLNGAPTTGGRAAPGDTLRLGDSLVLWVARYPRALPDVPDLTRVTGDFGLSDNLGLVGESPVMWELRRRLCFVARRAEHALVLGPSGSGKELAARAIHALSSRAARPLVARSAATLPPALVDAELFGNMRGFPNPGMVERRGLVGEADGSTLFLDEIGELPEQLQGHLLRVLDSGEYHRLGDSRARRSDLRLVAATNRSAESLKHDLAARLFLRLTMPGLNDRPMDVPLLVRHLLVTLGRDDPALARRFFRPDGEPRVEPRLVEALLRHRWQTHVRELRRLLFEAMTASPGDRVELGEELAARLTPPSAATDPASLSADAVRAALARNGGQVAQTWKALGLSSRHALYRLLRKHGITT